MDELNCKLYDAKRDVEKIEKVISKFYPNGLKGLSRNHAISYNKLLTRLNKSKRDVDSLQTQIDSTTE